jgi:hypothetical protein
MDLTKWNNTVVAIFTFRFGFKMSSLQWHINLTMFPRVRDFTDRVHGSCKVEHETLLCSDITRVNNRS